MTIADASRNATRKVRGRLGAAKRGAKRRLVERPMAGTRLMTTFARVHPDAFFIEVGSNDGEQHDHLQPFILAHEWRGVMVEPVPYVFARLRRNYGHLDRVALENAAISDRDGAVPFYYLVDANEDERRRLPDWYDGIGSLSREQVVSHAAQIADVEHRVVRSEVPSLTFDSLCSKHSVQRIDVLVIDTEGYDSEIVSRLDFGRWRPEVLIYEHFHLSPAERSAARARVEQAGYLTLEEHFDTICLAADADRRLRRTWRRLRPGLPGISVYD